jgi:thiamine-monophosphate kinase
VVAGAGQDDCGVIAFGGMLLVLSIDFLNATPIAEQLGLADARTLGRLAVAATLSDILGSGAVPRALLVGVTVPHGYPEGSFRQLMLGARAESIRWKVPIVGGDTKLGRARAVLTCGVGTAESKRELFLANRARPGDLVFASGNLGTCAAATFLASERRSAATIPAWARNAITVPELPVSQSRALARLRVANGGIDISDGLAADLRRMCEASRVGAVIDAEAIPVRPAVRDVAQRAGVPSWAFSMASGGDFQFLATVPPRASAKVLKLGFTQIGEIVRRRRLLLRSDLAGTVAPLPLVGHKDRRGQTFAAEIRRIVSEVKHAQES